MPQLSGVWEAQRRVDYFDLRLGCEPFQHLIYRLLIPSGDQFFGQLGSAVVKLRPPFLGRVWLNPLFQLEHVKSVVGFDNRAYIAGPKRLHRFFEHVRELTLVVTS